MRAHREDRAQYMKAYRKKPEVQEARREYARKPEVKEKYKKYQKYYNKRPHVQEKNRQDTRDRRKENPEYMREYKRLQAARRAALKLAQTLTTLLEAEKENAE